MTKRLLRCCSASAKLRRMLRCTRASAAVELAIFAPLGLLMALGVTDLGTDMYVLMTINATTQVGAVYGVINSGSAPATCATLSAACSQGIQAAMNDAAGDSSFCTSHATCTPSIAPCDDDPTTTCVKVIAEVPFTPLLPMPSFLSFAMPWGGSGTITATTKIRVI